MGLHPGPRPKKANRVTTLAVSNVRFDLIKRTLIWPKSRCRLKQLSLVQNDDGDRVSVMPEAMPWLR